MGKEAIDVLAVTAIAIAIGEGKDIATLDLLSAYSFLIGSTLKSLSTTKAIEQKFIKDNCNKDSYNFPL